MKLSMKQKQTRPMVAKAGWGIDWEVGIRRCKLFHTGWINNKVLL